MYSNFKSVQLLLAVLKSYNVSRVVLSPGGSDVPIIHSIEQDDFFECHSVVDERSAVYYAIGLSQGLNEPVVCVCTSGTAVSNYLPGMTEAYYQNVPIIAVTADKNPCYNGQIETQKISQNSIFGEVSLKSVELPTGTNSDELWCCERLIKEAVLASINFSQGPSHINIPIVGSYAEYDVKVLPSIKHVNYLTSEDSDATWSRYVKRLSVAKRILIVAGQNINFTDEDVCNIEKFVEKYNCMISVENISNLNCKGTIATYPITEAQKNDSESLIPDLVISFGNNVVSYGLKPLLRKSYLKFDHWSIDMSGRYRDVFKGLTDVICCSPNYFFDRMVNEAPAGLKSDSKYYDEWRKALNDFEVPEFVFSNLYVASKLSKVIPAESILHLAILNSARVMQYFSLADNVKSYSNIGALGIDGCLSSFMGQAASTNNLAFCLLGDLSFFYDMNALGIRGLKNNARLILLNNGGGAEFHLFVDKSNVPTMNNHVCAEHGKIARGWVESLGIKYLSASNKEELDIAVARLAEPSETPIFLEVFTEMENDAAITKKFYSQNKKTSTKQEVKRILKGGVKKVFGK